jgi:putative Holliday junction resolvase
VRVLGVDFGERRIGLALSDPSGTIASPLDTLVYRRGKRPPLRAIEEIVRTNGVERIVLGLPLDLSGEETDWCGRVREIGEEIGRRLAMPVDYVDERLTSVQAERALRSIGLRRSRRQEKGRVDAAAAALILQRWLDRRGDETNRGD